MLSATADYALRALLFLARGGPTPMKADVIARAIGAPPNYLSKTLNVLAREGIVASTRGPRGGFVLSVPSDQLTIGRIVRVFDDQPRDRRCLLRDAACNPETPCSAHQRWDAVSRAAREALAATSIAYLLESPATQ